MWRSHVRRCGCLRGRLRGAKLDGMAFDGPTSIVGLGKIGGRTRPIRV